MTDPRPVTEVLVEAIRDARDRDGWNAKTLAEACAKAGMPSLDQSTITNILNNRRQRIGVDEWLTLAYVLALPPAQMLLPLTEGTSARLTPTVVVGHDQALRWLLGEEAAPAPDGGLRDVERWERNGSPILRWRELWELTEAITELLRDRVREETRELDEEDPAAAIQVQQARLRQVDRRLFVTLRDLSEQYDLMRREQLAPPAPSDVVLREMDRLDVPRPKGFDR